MGILCLVFSHQVQAHRPAETHTSLSLEQNQLQVRIELPWSFNRAVKQAYPGITNQTPAQAFLDSSIHYVRSNFAVWHGSVAVQPNRWTLEDGEHGHSAAFTLSYPITSWYGVSIVNTLLTEQHQHQANHHSLHWSADSTLQFTTTSTDPVYLLPDYPDRPSLRISELGMLGLIPIGLLLFFWKQCA